MTTKAKVSRRSVAISMGGALAGAALASARPARAQSDKVFNWRMQTVDPPSFVGPAKVIPAWVKRIEEMSNGRLLISVFTAGQLVPTPEIPAALANGAIDIAYTSPVYYTGAIPESFLTSVALPPMLIPSTADGQEIYWNRGVDGIMREAYAENGVHFLTTLFLGDPITYWSKKPQKGVSDLAGFKVRTFGYAAKTFEKLGASPVFLPHEEVYTALAQGVIDGSMTAASYYQRAKYYEAAPCFYTEGWYRAVTMCMLASSRSWQALPDDLKAIVANATMTFSQDLQHQTWLEAQQMLTRFEKLGAQAVTWAPEDLAKVREAGMTFLPEIAAKGPRVAKGVEIVQKYLAEMGYAA